MDKITVYSTPVCTKCNNLKAWLKEEGYDEGSDYEVVNLFENADKANEFRNKNMLKLPIVEKNGEYNLGWDQKAKDFITAA